MEAVDEAAMPGVRDHHSTMTDHSTAVALQAVGAAAMLGGMTRMTLSITVLVMEGTGALQMIVPIMLAVFISKMVGDTLSLSIYDVQVKIRGAPALVSGVGVT